jgi:UMF1 family MFS transporter
MAQLNDPKQIRAWCMYDWANSVYNLSITTAVFPIYYDSITRSAAIARGASPEADVYHVELFGREIVSSAAYSYTLSIAYLLVSFVTPLLSGVADYGGLKKRMLGIFALIGALSCASMYWVTPETVGLSLALFLLAAFGWAGSVIYYNSFLPEIVTEDRYDEVSARGYAYGYTGSIILLILQLVVILFPGLIFDVEGKTASLVAQGLPELMAQEEALSYYKGMATRYAFVTVGIWWIGFAQLTLWKLPKEKALGDLHSGLLANGFKELKKVWVELRNQPKIKMYLLAFFFTSAGLQTVMYLATLFGSDELKLGTEKLIATVLTIQFIGIAGAFLFSKISSKIGNIYTLLIGIFVWLGICIAAYLVNSEYQFYALAAVVGTVMGGMQALLRSTYAKLIPDETPNHASYFSFYDVTEKLAIVFGTFAFGFINELTGTMRNSALSLAIFFVLGILLMRRIPNFKIHRG